MRLRLAPALLVALLTPLVAPDASAQPEIVPAEHPVYEFLHQQRVRGLLPEYRHELRPLGRARIQTHLDRLDERSGAGVALDAFSRDWLARYRREFFEPPEAIEAVIGPGGRIGLPLGAETEKFLYYHRSEDWRVALSAVGRGQLRLADEGEPYRGLALVPEGVLQGHWRGIVGFYSGTFDGLQVAGDTRVLQSDPTLASLYYVGRQDIPPGSFDRSTASLRVANRPGTAGGATFSAEVGWASLVAGASFGQPLVLSGAADHFGYVRLGLDTRAVQYHFLHAAIGDRAFVREGDDGDGVLLGPERYLAVHRLTVNPWRRLSLAFSEMVVYGRRGPELAYLNPLNPFKTAEHALWDRDNTLFALEGVLRPLDRVELYGTFLADDLDFGQFGQNSYNNKWAVQAGLGVTAGPALGWVEYTRIEPFVYTHRFLLDGSFYNSYTHNGFSLGHPLGPNADQWAVGLRSWLPHRVRAEVVGRYARRGENPVDPETGTVIENVGGDVTDGRQPPFSEMNKVFLAGDVFRGPGVTARLVWEPVRDIGLALLGDYQRWDGSAEDRLFVRAEVFVEL